MSAGRQKQRSEVFSPSLLAPDCPHAEPDCAHISEYSITCRQQTADLKGFNREIERKAGSFVPLCFSAASESERGESLHRECGQEAGDHGPADQVRSKPNLTG